MDFLVYLSYYMIPLIIFYIVGFGLLMKVDVYGEFVKGAKDGMQTVVELLPTLIGLLMSRNFTLLWGIGCFGTSAFSCSRSFAF